MNKLALFMGLAIVLLGCSKPKNNPVSISSEHVPPPEIIGRTYENDETMMSKTKTGQAATGLQWLYGIIGSAGARK